MHFAYLPVRIPGLSPGQNLRHKEKPAEELCQKQLSPIVVANGILNSVINGHPANPQFPMVINDGNEIPDNEINE